MSTIIEDLKLQFRSGDVITKLIFWNIALFAVPYILFGILKLSGFAISWMPYISLSSNISDLLWKPWSIISYAFFHVGIMHILFNLVMLHFSGRLFVTFFTQKQLLSLYFVGAIFAGIIYLISYTLLPALSKLNTELVGASGAVMAVLFAVATYAPMMQLRLLIIGNVKLWHIAIVILIIDLVQLSASNTGGHLAHLGGALFGYLYVTQIRKGSDITKWFTAIVDSVTNVFHRKPKSPFKTIHKNVSPTPKSTASRIVTKSKTQQQIDEILDKISKSGYDSLTAEEKEFLFRAGK